MVNHPTLLRLRSILHVVNLISYYSCYLLSMRKHPAKKQFHHENGSTEPSSQDKDEEDCQESAGLQGLRAVPKATRSRARLPGIPQPVQLTRFWHFLETRGKNYISKECRYLSTKLSKNIVFFFKGWFILKAVFFFILFNFWFVIQPIMIQQTGKSDTKLIQPLFYSENLIKQGPTRHTPMAHPVVFKYIS